MNLLKFVLFPFAVLYNGVTSLRNLLFDWGVFPVYSSKIPSIGIGNIKVGGTGKTPLADYILDHFGTNKVALISRGYGRKSKGQILANSNSTVYDIGDEPFMLYKKHSNHIQCVINADRTKAVKIIEDKFSETQLLVFDDVFQHRYVKPRVLILLTEFMYPFYDDYLMPMGTLREARRSIRRATLIIVTKCPIDISETQKEEFKEGIYKYTDKKIEIFFSNQITHMEGLNKPMTGSDVVLISGIANNKAFNDSISKDFNIIKHFEYPDHHMYSAKEIQNIINLYRESQLVCTEKDYYKIKALGIKSMDSNLSYLSLKTNIIEEQRFRNLLNSLV
ncbi:MAG: tetraacyldisaccharide 4'-kinase [Leadbetterella sp.]